MINKMSTTSLTLNEEQEAAKAKLIKFLNSKDELFMTLAGAAGTGKTTLLKYLLDYGSERKLIVGASLTHKARKVLDHTINKNRFVKIPTTTIASLLKKQKQNGYVGTKKYKESGTTIGNVDVVFIDEVSMVSDTDYKKILKYAEMYDTKILFIGDPAQIPHPTQKLVDRDGVLEKGESPAFKLRNTIVLNSVMRQGLANPLTHVYMKLREGLYLTKPCEYTTDLVTVGGEEVGLEVMSDYTQFCEKAKRFLNVDTSTYYNTKIICYTNSAVKKYNNLIKANHSEFEVGDLLMGYENLGYPVRIIENGQEYKIVHVKKTRNHKVHLDKKIVLSASGNILTIMEINRGTDGELVRRKESCLFVPDVHSEANYNIFEELIRRADNVNKPNSKTLDYIQYMRLKEQLIFFNSLFKWNGEILSEDEFIMKHPLLKTRVLDVIDIDDNGRHIKENKTSDRIMEIYGEIIQQRILDKNVIGDSEELKDRYQILTKDIDYGFAITTHKAQGSTYKHVFIDERDFNKLGDKWNNCYNMPENGVKERNQLKYVAFTRASHTATVLKID